MVLKNKILIILLCTGLAGLGQAKAQVRTDTIQWAKQLRDKADYKQAAAVLQKYSAHYPKDINALWLYAQTEFWMKHFKLSEKLYEHAIVLQPDKDYVYLDYAHVLLDMGEWQKADKVIKTLEKKGRSYSDQLLMRARISYYDGNYKTAESQVQAAMDSNTQSRAAKELYDDIMTAKSPWVKFGTSFYTDDQPMRSVTPFIEAGLYLHQYSSLQLSFYSPVFIAGKTSDAQMVSVGNTSSFKVADLVLKGDIGIDKFPAGDKVNWTGDIYLRKTFFKYLVFDGFAEYKPYLYTTGSLDSGLSVTHFATSLGWNDESFINGKIGFDLNSFAGGDHVYTLYGYAYAPPIKFSFVQLRFGYGYSYSNSKANDYSSTRSLDTIVKYFATDPTISGSYNPYFTPSGQNIHSALVSLRMNPSKHIEIGASAGIGFYAYIQNPYLYLDKNVANELYIARGYSREDFIPIDAAAYVEWRFAKKYAVRADYKYRSTYFYTSHSAGLSFKMNIRKS